MSSAQTAGPPAASKFRECESTALKDTTWQISDGLKKFSREEAERIVTSHGGTIHTDPNTPATHELKYAKDTYAYFGAGKATIFEPGFLGFVRGEIISQIISPDKVQHSSSLHKLTFIFTGTMPWLQKDEYKELIQEFGGRLQKKVNTNTDYVVVGYKDVPEAVMKVVKEMGVKTLDEDGFVELLKTRVPPGLRDYNKEFREGVREEARKKQAEKEAAEGGEESAGKEAGVRNGEEAVNKEDVEMRGEEKVVDKGSAGKTEETGAGKKSGMRMKKKDMEKQKNPVKKTAGVKKPSGGKANGKAQKEKEAWVGRLRSRAKPA